MTDRASLRCLLYADVAGRARLASKLGDAEAGYAVERCLNRMSRGAEAYSTSGLEQREEVIVARFTDPDAAVMAAREMRERVRSLPPMSGIKLVLRAGVVLESEGFDGGAVEALARRLVEGSNPDTIVVSDALGDVLSPAMRRLLGLADDTPDVVPPAPVAAEPTPPPVPVVASPPPVTPPAPRVEVPPPLPVLVSAVQPAVRQLRVSFRGQKWVIDAAHPTLLFGRETGNDIVVSDPRVSRQHARIELRNGQFYLADSSTNGTYLLEEGSAEQCIKRSEFALSEKGHIGCGFSVGDNMLDAVAFAID